MVTCYGLLNGSTCDGSGYDAHNRPTRKTYSVPAGVSATPTVVYCYDGQSYSNEACTGSTVAGELGRLTSVGNSASSTNYTHDLAGRVVSSTQRTTGVDPRTFTYSHFAGDAGGEEVYPSERRVVTCPDALQRVAWVSGSKTFAECAAGAAPSSSEAFASGIQYWPHGSLKQMTLGNGVVETTEYDNRLRMTLLEAKAADQTKLLGLNYTYYNNSNVQTQRITGSGLDVTESYEYDRKNRLTNASEASGWSRVYGYL